MQEYSPFNKNLNITRLVAKYKYDSARKLDAKGGGGTIDRTYEFIPNKNKSLIIGGGSTSPERVGMNSTKKPVSQVSLSSRKGKNMPIYERIKLPILHCNDDIDNNDDRRAISRRIRKKTSSVQLRESKKEMNAKADYSSIIVDGNVYERGGLPTSYLRNSTRERNLFSNLFQRLFELWIDIELSIDKKGQVVALIKSYFEILESETKAYDEDENVIYFFSTSKLNNFYIRMIKLQILILSTILILLTNFYTENHMKVQFKRLLGGVSSPLYAFYDIYLLQEGYLGKEYTNKLDILRKMHKLSIKDVDSTVVLLEKNLEIAMLLLKQLAK
jgi:hypothetical protein